MAGNESERIAVSIDGTGFEELAARLSDKELKATLKKLVRRPLVTLRKGVQRELSARVRPHRKNRFRRGKNGYWGNKPLKNDVALKVYKKGAIGGIVGLVTPKRLGNRAYVLRILNRGTAERRTKGGAYRGTGPALDFFRPGIRSMESQAVAEFTRQVAAEVKRLSGR